MRRARQIGVSALCLLVLAVAVGGATMWARGYRIYVIHTGSMVPTYVPGDIVVDAPAPRTVTPGEVITFRHTDLATDVVTHRVVGVTPAGLIRTKGDANQSVDAWQIPTRPGTRTHRVRGSRRWLCAGISASTDRTGRTRRRAVRVDHAVVALLPTRARARARARARGPRPPSEFVTPARRAAPADHAGLTAGAR